MTRRHIAALALSAVLLNPTVVPVHTGRHAQSWRLVGMRPVDGAAVLSDLSQLTPRAKPLVQQLAGMVEFDSQVGACHSRAPNCSIRGTGEDGSWGIHLSAQATSATYPSNRFIIFHELGHAVWGLLMDSADHQAFAGAVKTALKGRPCLDGLHRPCAPLGEVFADEFARYAGGFNVSMSDYWTPPLLSPATFNKLTRG
jgi:hypothetical protein